MVSSALPNTRPDLVAVFLGEQDKLWCAVPLIQNVPLFIPVLELIAHQRKPKVANAQAALTIHKDFVGLEIAVENVCGVKIFQAA